MEFEFPHIYLPGRYGGKSAMPAWEVAPLQDTFGQILQKTAAGKMSPYSGKVRSFV